MHSFCNIQIQQTYRNVSVDKWKYGKTSEDKVKNLWVIIDSRLSFYLFYRVNFINNEILKAHWQLEANQAPEMGLFLHQLTVQGVVSPLIRLPVAYNCCVQEMRGSTQRLSLTDCWDLNMQILYSSTSATGWPWSDNRSNYCAPAVKRNSVQCKQDVCNLMIDCCNINNYRVSKYFIFYAFHFQHFSRTRQCCVNW